MPADEIHMGDEIEISDTEETNEFEPAVPAEPETAVPSGTEFPSSLSSRPSETCKFYKIKGRCNGLIISWKYDLVNKLILIKRKDGIQYFRRNFKELSTLPYCELLHLAQLNIIYHSEDEMGYRVQRIVRKEVNSKQYFLLKPNFGTRYIYRNRLHPVSNKPWVKIVYCSPKALKKIPLEKLPLNFLKRMKYWAYDDVSGEAVIRYIPDSEPEEIDPWIMKFEEVRVYDPLSQINLTLTDLEALHSHKIEYIDEFKTDAIKFQKIVNICIAKGIHVGGTFPADWI